jgi:hypothetical protein
MRASPLCDEANYVAGLERLYRGAWAEWCAGRAAQTAGATAVSGS